MYRVKKSEAVRLYKYVKSVEIAFNPFDAKSTSARELWRRLSSPRLARSNPQAQLNIKTLTDKTALPAAHMTFVDGSEVKFDDISTTDVAALLSEMHMGAAKIDNVWAMEGKDLDDDI
mmetsp:Transcript_19428/g.35153  ORF Transcript_19428/g.35153 Transcript_19428/m.35153 type:complete len:118 (+) Transcript_19428:103-456(+)